MPANVAGKLGAAVEHHRAGRLENAESIYSEILALQPDHPDCLHLLGVIASETGRHEAAAASIGRAIRINPAQPLFYRNLGLALRRAGQSAAAIVAYCKALDLEPGHAGTLFELGRALALDNCREEAIACYRQALVIDSTLAAARGCLVEVLLAEGRAEEALACLDGAPGPAPAEACWLRFRGDALQLLGRWDESRDAYLAALDQCPGDPAITAQLGNVLHLAGRFAEAEDCYWRVLSADPRNAEVWYNLGVTLAALGQPEGAVDAYRRALEIQPGAQAPSNNLGTLLNSLGRREEAVLTYRQALAAHPGCVELRYNLGVALQDDGQLQQALAAYDEVLAIRPDHVQSLNNRGNALLAMGRVSEAVDSYGDAATRRPAHAESRWNVALMQLLHGDYQNGWPGYEWRFRQREFIWQTFDVPLWEGQRLEAGQCLLVHAEQGLGDTLQFVRYLALARPLVSGLVLECQPRLLPLLRDLPWADSVIARGDPLPTFHAHVPLLSLPSVFATTLETVPATVPYLRANPAALRRAAARLGGGTGRKVGLVWGGNPAHKQERWRAVPVEKLAALAVAAGAVEFYSLQRGPQAEALNGTSLPFRVTAIEEPEGTIADTAAAIMNLDLLISADTMTAHLAGALGRPVWVLLPHPPDWRWLLGRPDSPWYPTMRLFRQPAAGDWDSPLKEAAAALAHWAAADQPR